LNEAVTPVPALIITVQILKLLLSQPVHTTTAPVWGEAVNVTVVPGLIISEQIPDVVPSIPMEQFILVAPSTFPIELPDSPCTDSSYCIPVPLRATVKFALSGSLDGIVNVLVRVPLAEGEKTTASVQLLLGDTEFPVQVSFTRRNSGLLELIVPMERKILPELLMVIAIGVADDPTLTLPKATGEAGETTILDACPMPKSEKLITAVSGSFEGMLKVPLLRP
jgi:hypothetical protein